MSAVSAGATGATFDTPSWLFPAIFGVPVVMAVVALFLRYRAVKRRPPREDDPKTLPAGCLFAFCSIFFFAGLASFFFLTVRPTYRSMIAARWPTTQGTVIKSDLATSRDSDNDTVYRVDVRYRYRVDVKPYESNQYDGTGTRTYSGQAAAKRQIVNAHKPGTRVTVHYDPADPADAMLSTAIPPGTFSFLWFPLLFCTVPLGISYAFYRMGKYAGQPRPAKRVKHAPAAADSRRQRRGTFAGILIFTLFWNGFITFFWLASHTWCLLPFAVIGLLLAVWAGQQWLTLFNPTVSVSFSRMPLHPGDTCDVAYALEGNVLNVRSLSFKLEGREKVTYMQGTNSRTETRAVWTFPLTETTKNYDMEKGRFTIRLPADVMTSFVTTNNTFSWHLVCRGEIPRRPSIKDEFDVTVLPGEPS